MTLYSLLSEPNLPFLLNALLPSSRRHEVPKNLPKPFCHCPYTTNIHRRHIPEFLRFAQERSLSFMHEVNDWLEEHEVRDTGGLRARKDLRRLGVGLFGICSDAR